MYCGKRHHGAQSRRGFSERAVLRPEVLLGALLSSPIACRIRDHATVQGYTLDWIRVLIPSDFYRPGGGSRHSSVEIVQFAHLAENV
jgi:hypothetical protein